MKKERHRIFCDKVKLQKNKIIAETEQFVLFLDEFPVSEGHILIISKEHRENYLNLTTKEKEDLTKAIDVGQIYIKAKYNIDDFNVGFNNGLYAGQSVWHFHCHIIPRRKGDVNNPKGGIRSVIPKKNKTMNYKFELDENEIKVFEEWKKEQLKKSNEHHSFVGGRWSFTFTQTGIGTIVEVTDNNTKEIKTLTNFNKW